MSSRAEPEGSRPTPVLPAAPVGVLDSGLGGLSVLRRIADLLPQENLVYIADSAHAPYGEKSAHWIGQRSLALGQFLIEQGAKALVVACNTATAAAVPLMRERFAVPVVGMEPAIKPAVAQSQNGRIGVLATTGTLESARFAALLERFAQDVEVHTRSCGGWVEAVEAGQITGEEAERVVGQHVRPLLEKGVDTLILGCTHYPFLGATIAEVCRRHASQPVSLIETGGAVAQRLAAVLQEQGAMNDASVAGERRFYSSGEVGQQQAIVERLWGEPVLLQSLPALPA